MTARITGIASYLPERVLNNSDLEKMVDTTDEWIVTRTGMKERRIAAEGEHTSDMGTRAAERALKKAGLEVLDIDLIIVATMTPDHFAPSTAALVQSKLGATNASAMDFQAACSGYLYGLSMAKAYVESGMHNNVLLVASEKLSAFMNYKDRDTCILFGDGAAASVIRKEGAGLEIRTIELGTDGSQSEILMIPAGGSGIPTSKKTLEEGQHFVKMNGKELYKHAVRRMEGSIKKCLDSSRLREEDISWLVPHQANLRIIDGLAKRFSLPAEKVYINIHKYGNTSAPSVAIALDELLQEKEVAEGENLMLVAFGAGLTWGSTVLTKISA
jgi:3-oxoacyl-[acyl-carrier-protein] synthase III